jgi:hypothetical protein
VLGFEVPRLELDDDARAKLEVIEEQIEVEVLATDLRMHLA